jgi:integrase
MKGDSRLKRLKLGDYPATTLKEAHELWRDARKTLQQGRDPAARRPSCIIEEVVKEWLQKDQEKNRSYRAVAAVMQKYVLPIWGKRDIADIRKRDIIALIDSVVAAGKMPMARKVHAMVSRLFRWCAQRDILDANPASEIAKPGAPQNRDRVLTDTELATVWNATEGFGWPQGFALRLLILTGARRDEIWKLRWDELDGDILKLPGKRMKEGLPHTVPLSAAAMELLQRCPQVEGQEYVFALRGTRPSDTWGYVKRLLDAAAPVAPWRIHDLRRTVATGMQRLGVPLPVTEAVLGHISGSRSGVVGIYQRYGYDEEKRQALEKWAAHVAEVVARGRG